MVEGIASKTWGECWIIPNSNCSIAVLSPWPSRLGCFAWYVHSLAETLVSTVMEIDISNAQGGFQLKRCLTQSVTQSKDQRKVFWKVFSYTYRRSSISLLTAIFFRGNHGKAMVDLNRGIGFGPSQKVWSWSR